MLGSAWQALGRPASNQFRGAGNGKSASSFIDGSCIYEYGYFMLFPIARSDYQRDGLRHRAKNNRDSDFFVVQPLLGSQLLKAI